MSDIDEPLEQLLSKASPRPAPTAAETAVVRESVREEWRSVSDRRQRRSSLVRFAIAATVIIGLFSLFNVFRVPVADTVTLASVQKSFGTVHFVGGIASISGTAGLSTISAGQSIITGQNAGIALAWQEGGSLRLAENSEVEFMGSATIYLHSGKIYFDSTPSALLAGADAADASALTIESGLGAVTHRGTQFMTEVNADTLRVTVREGSVDVSGKYYSETAVRGQQIEFPGRQRPIIYSVSGYGEVWDWISSTTPPVQVDGKSIHEFLDWVSRELGASVDYADDSVERYTRENAFRGRIDSEPAQALKMRMDTTGLNWRFSEGVIYVGNGN